MTERYAVFYAPATDSALWRRAAQWLGRNAATGAVPAAAIPGISRARLETVTASARRYGFHATLKPPMTLRAGTTRAGLEAALARFAEGGPPVPLGRLRPTFLYGFLALMPEAPSAALQQFAADCVTGFEPFRAPLSPADRAQRLRQGDLSQRQVELLDAYGYPYVMEEFQFHMTLADRLPAAEQPAVLAAAQGWFSPLAREEVVLDRICLFHEPEAGAPFRRVADFPLTAGG
jgi:putative phosphonate metabolism protein